MMIPRPVLVSLAALLLSAALAQAQPIPIVHVTASSWQEPNRPINTLASITLTSLLGRNNFGSLRWSAQSTAEMPGQWVQYELAPGPWCLDLVRLVWWQSRTRSVRFEIAVSPDGTTWETVLAWRSRRFSGVQDQEFTGRANSCVPNVQHVRLTGFGEPQHGWNSLQAAEFYGSAPPEVDPPHLEWQVTTSDEPDVDNFDALTTLTDRQAEIAWPIPAQSWIEVGLIPPDVLPNIGPVCCIALYWAESSVPFTIDVVQDGVATPLLQATSGPEATFQVYAVDPALDQRDPSLPTSFRITPAVDASLREARFLLSCQDEQAPQYASSVWAAAFATVPYSPPANTLDGDTATFWSARGTGAQIVYVLREGVQRGVGIQWWRTDRTNFFDVEMSIDGRVWYPVLTDGASRQESGVEWYDFPPTYGSYLRIIGHGNTRTPWTSILEVQFGSAPPARVALQ